MSFLIHYNAILYEKQTRNFFKSFKLSIIEFVLIIVEMSISTNNIIESVKKSFSILLWSILMTFIIKHVYSIGSVNWKRKHEYDHSTNKWVVF